MSPKFILILLAAALILTACNGTTNQSAGHTPTAAIPLEDCHLSAPGFNIRLPARCGTLLAAEDPDNPGGRRINLRIALIPAISRNPAPDPLFFITGGPGQAASESYALLSHAFERVNQKRDIVLVDQRGTGESNSLDCEFDEEFESVEVSDEQLDAYLRSCLDSIDADPRFYTTSIAVRDLEAVRQALGYPQINLYGLSYGTRVALEYLRRYPQSVRTVILDGTVPPQEALGDDVSHDAQHALDLILARCEAESACGQAFPNVRQEFDQVLRQLRSEPVILTIPDPVSGEDIELTFTAGLFGVAIRLLSYSQETIALLPLLIHTAASGDFQVMAAQYLIVGGDLSRSISQGMGYSVLCTEDVPFHDPNRLAQAIQETYLGGLQIEELRRTCDLWPAGEIPLDFKQPVVSEVPVLLLSGEFDPVTPPENAELVSQDLANSLHLVAAGQGHNVIIRGCLPRVATSFIEQGSSADLETQCVQAIQPLPFFVNFSGPVP